MFNSIQKFLSGTRQQQRRLSELSIPSPPVHALAWIRSAEMKTGGIRVHSGHESAYPEVTGYLIPTLLRSGDREIVQRLVRWLIAIQRADGSFTDPDHGKSYIFDTGQALRGLLAAVVIEPSAIDSARRAADYLCREMKDNGRGGFGIHYDGSVPENVHLYVLAPLIEASEVLDYSFYRNCASNCLDYYLLHDDLLHIDDLTHFLAYQLEALIDLGHAERAVPVLGELKRIQLKDGSVRGVNGQTWVCSPGLAQMAICWYKTGDWESGDKALAWLEAHQTEHGGFLGSYGNMAPYFPAVELSWTAKYYLDAHYLRVMSFIERNSALFPEDVSISDGRFQTVMSMIQTGDSVVEIGCGKGRFLKAIKSVQPDTQCSGVDISPLMISSVPEGIAKIIGSLEQIPFPENSFDVVFSVEAVEHSVNVEEAIQEMIRVAKPGGWIIIIDKQNDAWGQLDCPSWERWPDKEHLTKLLRAGCDQVTCEELSYDGIQPDGLMVAWRGRKRSRLTGSEWNAKLVGNLQQSDVLTRLRSNKLSSWGLEILMATRFGEKVLEVGSGTGEISLALALAGRGVAVMDISPDSIEFTKSCAIALGLEIETLSADATKPLPLPDNSYDCIWSSGLLEHFSIQERQRMLNDWRRVTRDRVITLVPNAASVAYRAGKKLQENEGSWPYGLEVPIKSMYKEFTEAGLRVLHEFTIGARHALDFLPTSHPLRESLSVWMERQTIFELQDCNQGYLLMTVGTKLDKAC